MPEGKNSSEKKVLIVGGTRQASLGFALASRLARKGHQVWVTTREAVPPNNPMGGFSKGAKEIVKRCEAEKVAPRFLLLNTSYPEWVVMTNSFNAILKEMGSVDTFIYTPGFYQEGNLAEISLSAIEEMIKVGLHVPIMLIRELLHHQTKIPELVLVTSTSQFVPREKEPVYTAVKAGLGQLGNSLSLDPRIEKTLVVAPAGMKTRFWKETNIDTKTMLSPAWVAGKIIALMNGVGYSYLCAKILREPPRIELIERR